MRASPSSTRPTSTAAPRVKSTWDARWVGAATKWWWPRSSAAGWTSSEGARGPSTCIEPWRTASGAWARTASTSTSCTPPTLTCRSVRRSAPSTSWFGPARCARSAARISRPTSCARRRRRRAVAQRGSRACRTSTAFCTAPQSKTFFPNASAGLAFIPYFPLANGLLTGKYRRGQDAPEGSRLDSARGERLLTDRNLAMVEQLIEFSGLRGYTILELAFSWLLRRPGVASAIAGATSPEQARSNAAAAGWKLTDAELAEVDSIATGPV